MSDHRTPLQRHIDTLRDTTAGHLLDTALAFAFFAAFGAVLVAALLGVI